MFGSAAASAGIGYASVASSASRAVDHRGDRAVDVLGRHQRLVPLHVQVDVGRNPAGDLGDAVGAARRRLGSEDGLAARRLHAAGDAGVVRRHQDPVHTLRGPHGFQDVDHHGSAGQGSEGFSRESDGGVARGYYGDDRHAIISGDSILGLALRQETPPRPLWSRPAAAALFALAVVADSDRWRRSRSTAPRADRAHATTGRAEWIWYSSRVPKPVPLRFYAVREFALNVVPPRSTARVFVDREHVLYVNGERAGGATQRPGDALATYELASLLRPGGNRVVIEASSPTGIGGILFALDLGGQTLVSDGRWRVDRDAAALTGEGRYRPVVWGRPPHVSLGLSPREPLGRRARRSRRLRPSGRGRPAPRARRGSADPYLRSPPAR